MSPDPPGLFAEGFAGLRWHRQLEDLKKFSCLFNDQEVVACRLSYTNPGTTFFWGFFLGQCS